MARIIAVVLLLITPLFAHAAVITAIPNWFVALSVLGVIVWVVLKIVFSLGGAAVNSIQTASAEREDKKNFYENINNRRSSFAEGIEEINLSYDTVLATEHNLDYLKKIISAIFDVEIYDDKHLIGKSLKEIENKLVEQLVAYGQSGGLL